MLLLPRGCGFGLRAPGFSAKEPAPDRRARIGEVNVSSASRHIPTQEAFDSMADEPEWEIAFHRANALWAQGRREDALSQLGSARDRYSARKDLETAAFFSSLLGSFRSICGEESRALEEHRRAVDLDPTNAHWHTTLAEHLLSVGRVEPALEEVQQCLQLISADERSTYHAAKALEGFCLLKLGKIEAAIAAFRAATVPKLLEGLPARSCDLRLLEALSEKELESTRCEEYLELVISRAESEQESEVRRWAERIRTGVRGRGQGS